MTVTQVPTYCPDRNNCAREDHTKAEPVITKVTNSEFRFEEYDKDAKERVAITAVISGGRVHFVPTEWVDPDAEYVRTSEHKDDDRFGQYEDEQPWVDYNAPEKDFELGAAKQSSAFPVLSGMVHYYHSSGDVMQECFRPGCNHRLTWGGFAGDAYDFAITGMLHWYDHSRRGVVATKNRWTFDVGLNEDEDYFRQFVNELPEE